MPLRLNTVKQFANAFDHAWLINTAFRERDQQIPPGKRNLSYDDVQAPSLAASVFLALSTAFLFLYGSRTIHRPI
jgi:hypothetical protein